MSSLAAFPAMLRRHRHRPGFQLVVAAAVVAVVSSCTSATPNPSTTLTAAPSVVVINGTPTPISGVGGLATPSVATPWTTSAVSIGEPAVVKDQQGRSWVLVLQDSGPTGSYVAMGPVPPCSDGSEGQVAIVGDHQSVRLDCHGRSVANWFGDGTPQDFNPEPYASPLGQTPLTPSNNGRLSMSG
jgi:hypothetical protein